MAMIQFDARQVKPSQGWEPLADGRYPVTIRKSNILENSKGTGGYLKLEMEVLPGHPDAGRTHFDNLNLWHGNPQTVQIANEQLSAYCWATGVMNVQDQPNAPDNAVPMLHNIPFQIQIRNTRDKQGQINTSIAGWYDINGNKAGQGPAPSGQPQGGPPANFAQPQPQPQTGQQGGFQAPQTNAAPQPQWQAPQGQGQPQPQPQNPGGGQPQWSASQGQQGQPGPAPQTGAQPQWGPPPPAGGPAPGNAAPQPQGQPQWGAPQGQPQTGGQPQWGQQR